MCDNGYFIIFIKLGKFDEKYRIWNSDECRMEVGFVHEIRKSIYKRTWKMFLLLINNAMQILNINRLYLEKCE